MHDRASLRFRVHSDGNLRAENTTCIDRPNHLIRVVRHSKVVCSRMRGRSWGHPVTAKPRPLFVMGLTKSIAVPETALLMFQHAAKLRQQPQREAIMGSRSRSPCIILSYGDPMSIDSVGISSLLGFTASALHHWFSS